MINSQFKTKEEYLLYRKKWKEEYKQLSQTIRERKWLYEEFNRMWNRAIVAHGTPFALKSWETNKINSQFWNYLRLLEKENTRYQTLKKKYEKDQNPTELYIKKATQMLEELKESKLKVSRQYNVSYIGY